MGRSNKGRAPRGTQTRAAQAGWANYPDEAMQAKFNEANTVEQSEIDEAHRVSVQTLSMMDKAISWNQAGFMTLVIIRLLGLLLFMYYLWLAGAKAYQLSDALGTGEMLTMSATDWSILLNYHAGVLKGICVFVAAGFLGGLLQTRIATMIGKRNWFAVNNGLT
jgi:hypothetical protein